MLAQLGDLQQAGGDAGTSAELQNQLAALKSLSQNIASASGTALMQLRGEVAATVSASRAAAQQAQTAIVAASSSTQQAEYARVTAELDRRVAATFAEDKRHEDEAHERARRYGVDLTELDKQREDLERERQAAIARGDKVAERQADVLIAQNTKATMIASRAPITDSAERQRLDHDLADQQQNIDIRQAAYEAQLELQANRSATRENIPDGDRAAYVAAHKTEGIEAMRDRSEQLAELGNTEATRLALKTEIKTAMADQVASPTNAHVEAALTPEAKAATAQAAVTVKSDFSAAIAASGFEITLDSPQIVLSSTPDAHTTVEVPRTSKAPVTRGQSLV